MYGHIVWCDCTVNLIPASVSAEAVTGMVDDLVLDGQLAQSGTCSRCLEQVKVAQVTAMGQFHTLIIRMTNARPLL
jgi:hypothetical protein